MLTYSLLVVGTLAFLTAVFSGVRALLVLLVAPEPLPQTARHDFTCAGASPKAAAARGPVGQVDTDLDHADHNHDASDDLQLYGFSGLTRRSPVCCQWFLFSRPRQVFSPDSPVADASPCMQPDSSLGDQCLTSRAQQTCAYQTSASYQTSVDQRAEQPGGRMVMRPRPQLVHVRVGRDKRSSFGFGVAFPNGRTVNALHPGGTAEAAGLRVGDVLVQVNGVDVQQLHPDACSIASLLRRDVAQCDLVVQRAGAECAVETDRRPSRAGYPVAQASRKAPPASVPLHTECIQDAAVTKAVEEAVQNFRNAVSGATTWMWYGGGELGRSPSRLDPSSAAGLGIELDDVQRSGAKRMVPNRGHRRGCDLNCDLLSCDGAFDTFLAERPRCGSCFIRGEECELAGMRPLVRESVRESAPVGCGADELPKRTAAPSSNAEERRRCLPQESSLAATMDIAGSNFDSESDEWFPGMCAHTRVAYAAASQTRIENPPAVTMSPSASPVATLVRGRLEAGQPACCSRHHAALVDDVDDAAYAL